MTEIYYILKKDFYLNVQVKTRYHKVLEGILLRNGLYYINTLVCVHECIYICIYNMSISIYISLIINLYIK